MSDLRNVPWELWLILLATIGLAVIPPFVGYTFVRIYRRYNPEEEKEVKSFMDIGEEHDGFFKILFVGWLFCGPIAVLVFFGFVNNTSAI